MRAKSFADWRVFFAAAAVTFAAVLLVLLRPEQLAALPPLCPWKAATGYDCPGCGMLRALSAVLHGDLPAAMHYNAAVVVVAPILAFEALRRGWRLLKTRQNRTSTNT